jgi:hypothetical protein
VRMEFAYDGDGEAVPRAALRYGPSFHTIWVMRRG